ncbi:hypothetical protein [Rodentibacter mrazii]|uniref:hypothetical protein n=1 Tax=Rodentibacter mrazii TaxID=1908257 RepID=UPI0009840FB8|nr:hypothetical protein [Rodentibacter mrazii]
MSLINQSARFNNSKFARKVKVKRLNGEHSASGFNADYQELELLAIVMPTTHNDMLLLNEQERYLPSLKIYTLEPLNIGDLVCFRGNDYKIKELAQWGDYGYYNQIGVRHSPTAKVDSNGFTVT